MDRGTGVSKLTVCGIDGWGSIPSCGRVVSFRDLEVTSPLSQCVGEATRLELEAGHYNLHASHVCCLVTVENWAVIPLSTFHSVSHIWNALPGHYAIGDYVTEAAAATKLRLMTEDLYFEFVPTIVRKGSPYIEKFNKLIHRLLDSGLMLKWEEQVRYISLVQCTMTARHRSWISVFSRSASPQYLPLLCGCVAEVPAIVRAHIPIYAYTIPSYQVSVVLVSWR
jgi:hypothetical protein